MVSAAALLVALVACGGGSAGTVGTPDAGVVPVTPVTGDGTKGTGTGGSGVPRPTSDAAAWFITFDVTSATTAINLAQAGLDFDALPLQGAVQGGIAVGASRPAGVLVYNVSRKTDLHITAASVSGADASDFALDAANVANALATTIPANQSAFVRIGVTFTPQAAGLRTASLDLTSNAGTASVALTGTGLPQQPVLQTNVASGSLTFSAQSAPAIVRVTNAGGADLTLSNIAVSGANSSAFTLSANPALGQCHGGTVLGSLQGCSLEIGPATGQVAPKSASLDLASNDPAHPTVSIQLVLQ